MSRWIFSCTTVAECGLVIRTRDLAKVGFEAIIDRLPLYRFEDPLLSSSPRLPRAATTRISATLVIPLPSQHGNAMAPHRFILSLVFARCRHQTSANPSHTRLSLADRNFLLAFLGAPTKLQHAAHLLCLTIWAPLDQIISLLSVSVKIHSVYNISVLPFG